MMLIPFEVRGVGDLGAAVGAAAKERIGGLILPGTPMFVAHRREIAALLTKHQLPAVSIWRSFADAGVLMSYGPDLSDEFRRAASYVDKILRGAKPGELPVERPTKCDLVINVKTAKTRRLTIPPSLLLRADQVIE